MGDGGEKADGEKEGEKGRKRGGREERQEGLFKTDIRPNLDTKQHENNSSFDQTNVPLLKPFHSRIQYVQYALGPTHM